MNIFLVFLISILISLPFIGLYLYLQHKANKKFNNVERLTRVIINKSRRI